MHASLQALEESSSMEVETTHPEPSPRQVPAPSPRRPLSGNSGPVSKSPSGGGAVGAVSERLELYKRAVQQSEVAGESSKARRYKRSITTLEQVHMPLCARNANAPHTVSVGEREGRGGEGGGEHTYYEAQ